jgi:APA family basic amino acid/polyamine antiporter
LCYAELSSVIPISGSAYTYSYATMGELVAWIVGWCLVLEYGVAASTVAVGWSKYFISLMADFGWQISPIWASPTGTEVILADGSTVSAIFNIPAFLAVGVVTAVLIAGIKESAAFNAFIVVVKLAVIVVFIAFGVFYIDPANWTPFIPENQGPGRFGWEGIFTGAGVIFFAYIGFDAVATAAQEAKNPQKDIPVGIMGSLIICTILYMMVAAVLTGVVPFPELGVPDPIAVATDRMGLPWLSFIVKIGAILGLSSVMLVLAYAQIRINYVMSRDGLLPPVLSKVHPKFRTPYISTIFWGTLIAFAAATTPISTLGHLVSMGTLTAFLFVCAGVWYLHRTQPNLERPFKCPLVPWVPAGGIGACCYLIYSLPIETFYNFSAWLILGALIYFFYGRMRSVAGHSA